MLRQQNTHSSAPPWLGDLNQIDEPVSPPTSFDHRGLARSSRDLDGILHVDENGYVRFIAGSPQWQSSRLASIDVSAGVSGSIARFPAHSINTTSMEELVSALPSRRHCAELVQIYFQSYASLFHVLHDPTFRRQYEEFEQTSHNITLSWLALLYAILGAAVNALSADSPLLDLSHKQHPLDKVEELSSRYRTLAMRCLEADHYLWRHNVATLQSLILLIYSINHSHGQSWNLLGLTHHLALSIGCHVDPSRLGLGAVQCEERRRCWAALKMLYTHQNTAMGHPGIAHAYFPSNCRAPADIDDDTLHPDMSDDALGSLASTGGPTQMTYLLKKFRLYDLCTDICEHVLCKSCGHLAQIRRLDGAIQREQRSWDTQFFAIARTEQQLAPHHRAHVNILRSYAHHLTLLLHQQVILRTSDAANDEDVLRWSSVRCLDAAMSILHVHAYVQNDPELQTYQWYNRGLGSFHAFHATVVLVMMCQRGLHQNRKHVIGPALRDCHARFAGMGDLSPFCAKAAPLLQMLVTQFESASQTNDIIPEGYRRLPGNLNLHQGSGTSDVQSHTAPAAFENSAYADPGVADVHNLLNHDPPVVNDDDILDWNELLAEMPPQQWVSPAVFPLEQWFNMNSNRR
ncbi:hypothetical protein CKM354_000212200 [Cercospora kikuchii]|uniref:Xylanolytic transcriptional activator regulatory domain-containing protein n=2 Tax=Cercospora kikuchii TaxID=84275 RepID=A0A9P3F8Y8_9PEZI|nr:uncharacterized protein CKM354_000212200 [Cercospora kikuchii]GIZ38716.1 hypothetical protein CKM354_000212200 [Cercospora kikuchii]